jgi:hypothetical protein
VRQLLYGAAVCGLLGLVGQHGPAVAQNGKSQPADTGIKKVAEPGETCGQHGTSVNFLASPSEAAQKADKEQKLVFVLHVSGNFETPEFT